MSTGKRRWAAIGALVVAATLTFALQARQRQIRKERDAPTGQVNDFDRWLGMAPELIEGGGEYVDDRFPTPPVTLLVFAPFTRLDKPTAQFAWVALKALIAAAILWLGVAMVGRAGVELTASHVGLVLASWLWPVIIDLQQGQLNLVMLLALMTGLWLAQAPARAAQVAAGVTIALACCIKVTPLLFLPYFAWRRRWLLSAAAIAGLGLWLLVVPGLAFGWERNLRWLGDWAEIMILPYAGDGQVSYYNGQSLASFLTRTLCHVPAFTTTVDGARVPHYVNVADLPATLVAQLTRMTLVAIGLAGLYWARRPLATLACRRYILEIGALVVLMLWASERTWVPHYVSLLPALLAVAMLVADPEQPARGRRRAVRALVTSAVLMFLTTDVARILGPHGTAYVRIFGVCMWASLVLAVTILRTPGAPPRARAA